LQQPSWLLLLQVLLEYETPKMLSMPLTRILCHACSTHSSTRTAQPGSFCNSSCLRSQPAGHTRYVHTLLRTAAAPKVQTRHPALSMCHPSGTPTHSRVPYFTAYLPPAPSHLACNLCTDCYARPCSH
jgi:hypothetical protein